MSPLGGLLPLVLKLIPLGLICCILPHAAPTCDGHHRIRDPEATLHPLADEILKYRQALRLLARAIGWAEAGASFGLFPQGSLREGL
jgi:hypothetical protein